MIPLIPRQPSSFDTCFVPVILLVVNSGSGEPVHVAPTTLAQSSHLRPATDIACEPIAALSLLHKLKKSSAYSSAIAEG